LSKDPAGFGGGSNFYVYAYNDPINLIDPEGEIPLAPIILGGLIGGGIEAVSQLIDNGGEFGCLDYGKIGFEALKGAAFGGILQTITRTEKVGRLLQAGLKRTPGLRPGGALNRGKVRFGSSKVGGKTAAKFGEKGPRGVLRLGLPGPHRRITILDLGPIQ
jgi:hypothetical protein